MRNLVDYVKYELKSIGTKNNVPNYPLMVMIVLLIGFLFGLIVEAIR